MSRPNIGYNVWHPRRKRYVAVAKYEEPCAFCGHPWKYHRYRHSETKRARMGACTYSLIMADLHTGRVEQPCVCRRFVSAVAA